MTTVFIWNNNLITGKLPGRHSYSGHASLSIDDDWSGGGSTLDNYVSFWPDAGGTLNQAVGVAGAAKETIIADLVAEGYAPDHVLRLDGLDEAAMRGEWTRLRQKNAKYSFVRNSCATVAARVLRKGTADKTAGHLVWTPLEVKRLALAMGAAPIAWTMVLREMALLGLIGDAEETMLAGLGKRDQRHGSSTQVAYFARGQRIADKTIMGKTGPSSQGGYKIFAGGVNNMAYGDTRTASMADGDQHKTGTATLMNPAYAIFNYTWQGGQTG